MPTPKKDKFTWLNDASVKKLVAALGSGNVRFVGGIVRDSLLGRPTGDFDVATLHSPEKAMKLLEANGIKVAPTGLKHGTVTAIVDSQPFEVTTLRADVKTHGRHADVEFHDDWEEDAKRRDFTMNALYLSPEGELFDYFGGMEDLKNGFVRFIGKPENRIKEDTLRVLRFFRFQAWFGKGELDADGLVACKNSVALLDILSAERIRDELLKILSAPDPGPMIREMEKIKVFHQLFGDVPVNVKTLEELVMRETALENVSALRRLSAVLPIDSDTLTARLKLSNKESKRLAAMHGPIPECPKETDIRRMLYQDGRNTLEDRLLLRDSNVSEIQANMEIAAAFEILDFPVSGSDLEKLGVKPGKEMGNILKELEQAWIESDFTLSKKDLLKGLP